jgi:hypothetical protein
LGITSQGQGVWPRPSSGLGGFEGMVRGLAQPFAARLFGDIGLPMSA